MPLLDRRYLASLDKDELVDALAAWEWLIGPEMKPLFLTLSGDLFLRDAAGATFWLDAGLGRLQQVAQNEGEFEQAWADEAKRSEWLLKPVIDDLLASGQIPDAGQCFGYRMMPALGGEYAGDNRTVFSAHEHVSFAGYLHSQIRDLPDGSTVEIEVVD